MRRLSVIFSHLHREVVASVGWSVAKCFFRLLVIPEHIYILLQRLYKWSLVYMEFTSAGNLVLRTGLASQS